MVANAFGNSAIPYLGVTTRCALRCTLRGEHDAGGGIESGTGRFGVLEARRTTKEAKRIEW